MHPSRWNPPKWFPKFKIFSLKNFPSLRTKWNVNFKLPKYFITVSLIYESGFLSALFKCSPFLSLSMILVVCGFFLYQGCLFYFSSRILVCEGCLMFLYKIFDLVCQPWRLLIKYFLNFVTINAKFFTIVQYSRLILWRAFITYFLLQILRFGVEIVFTFLKKFNFSQNKNLLTSSFYVPFEQFLKLNVQFFVVAFKCSLDF